VTAHRLSAPPPELIDERATAPVGALPSEREALRFWFKLGCISFGGPAGQIAIMHDELVERRRWISEKRFLHALNFCMALPGPEAQQLAAYVGYRLHGVRGALAAGGLFVLPSFLLLCLMSGVYVEYGTVPEVAGIVRGLGAAVVALVLAAILRVGGRVIHTPAALAMAAAAFGLIVGGVPFPIVVVIAALVGYTAGRARPRLLGKPAAHGDADAVDEPATNGAAAEPRLRRRFLQTLVAWLAPVAALLLVGGVVADLTGLFTITALVTFGGAYAVLPFVADQAVNNYHWLSAKDMVAGLALGESTPGPLIMVNVFVGFVAAYNVEGGLAWGLAGAAITTFCTFAPCFFLIINGAPIIDRISTAGSLANALNGITIAVVGVIGGLAVFVAQHALFPTEDPQWLLIALAAVAFIAVWRYRLGVVKVVAVCAAVGLAEALIR
jgi:chromate transporter